MEGRGGGFKSPFPFFFHHLPQRPPWFPGWSWQAVVLIPKGKNDYRGIGLVEVMWKVVAVIINRRFTSSITYHDVLHGFRAGRGTGTATLEAKLIQQLASMR